jgi:hypothetical protein
MILRAIPILCTAAAITLAPRQGEACMCRMSLAAACEVYGQYAVAFVGRIVKAGYSGGDARIRIDRAWKGAKAGAVEVMRNEANFSCGYRFERGADYVIFARRNGKGEIQIEQCSSTIWKAPTPAHADGIRFLESLSRPPSGGWIFGTVDYIAPNTGYLGDGARPVEGAIAIAKGPVEKRTSVVRGRFDFEGLPPGRYWVRVEVPAWLPKPRSIRAQEGADVFQQLEPPGQGRVERVVTISHDRSCAFNPFGVFVGMRPPDLDLLREIRRR